MLSRRTFTFEQGKRTHERIQQWDRYGIRATARLDKNFLAQNTILKADTYLKKYQTSL